MHANEVIWLEESGSATWGDFLSMFYNRGVRTYCVKCQIQNNKKRAGPRTTSSIVIG